MPAVDCSIPVGLKPVRMLYILIHGEAENKVIFLQHLEVDWNGILRDLERLWGGQFLIAYVQKSKFAFEQILGRAPPPVLSI